MKTNESKNGSYGKCCCISKDEMSKEINMLVAEMTIAEKVEVLAFVKSLLSRIRI